MYVIRNLMCFLAKPKCRVQLADDNLGGEESVGHVMQLGGDEARSKIWKWHGAVMDVCMYVCIGAAY